jgi:hypothetical protein
MILMTRDMENNNTMNEFFEFINHECIFYSINVNNEGKVQVKWKNMQPEDYNIVPEINNRINLRVHKSKQKACFFLDFFQYFEGRTYWRGFRMGHCTHYEMLASERDWFDVVFYFENNQQITIHHINTKVFLILQDFFSGFM